MKFNKRAKREKKEDKMSKPTKEEISRTYEEAAAIDGCHPMRTFWKIMFPMAQSGIVTVTIFNFINIWNEYFLSEKIIGGVTGGIKG